MFIHFPISKNYHLEFGLFDKFYSDSFCCFDCDLTLNKKKDHCPRFEFLFAIKNVKIIEFNIYNIHHADSKEIGNHQHITETERD